jgi:hypothetical protein
MHYFIADKDAKKRDKVVAWLVGSGEHARHAAKKATASSANGASVDPLGRLLDKMLADGKSDADVLSAMTLAALARFPTDSEKALVNAQLAKQPDRRVAWNDILSTLLILPEVQQHIDGLNNRRSEK